MCRTCHTDVRTPAAEQLATLGRRRKRATGELNALRSALVTQVIAAGRAGVPQVVVVELTGLTRDEVRKLWRSAGIGPTDPRYRRGIIESASGPGG